jgi:hypothetical protein
MHPLPLGSQRTPPRPRRDYITAEGRCTTEMLGRTAAASAPHLAMRPAVVGGRLQDLFGLAEAEVPQGLAGLDR